MSFGTTNFGTGAFGTASALNLISATALSPNSVALTFDAPVATNTVTLDPTSYVIEPGPLAVLLVVISGTQVVLHTVTQVKGRAYTVTVASTVVGEQGQTLENAVAMFTGVDRTRRLVGTLEVLAPKLVGTLESDKIVGVLSEVP